MIFAMIAPVRGWTWAALTGLLERAARVAFLMEFRSAVVAPGEHQPAWRIDFQDLAAVGGPAVGNHDPPRGTRLPGAVLPGLEEVAAGELGVRERLPQLLRRRADVGHVDEARFSHCSLLPVSA